MFTKIINNLLSRNIKVKVTCLKDNLLYNFEINHINILVIIHNNNYLAIKIADKTYKFRVNSSNSNPLVIINEMCNTISMIVK